MITVIVITTTVEAISSRRVDHETLMSSCLTSLIKFIGLAKIFILNSTGAAGVEPAVTVLETVGLPLTDAPKKNHTFRWFT